MEGERNHHHRHHQASGYGSAEGSPMGMDSYGTGRPGGMGSYDNNSAGMGSYDNNSMGMGSYDNSSTEWDLMTTIQWERDLMGAADRTTGGRRSSTSTMSTWHERHEIGKDPEHARRHRVEEELGTAAALGAGGYALHEHHDMKEAKKMEEEGHGKHHRHLFRS
ncbi:abscisic stress-ripening protein 5-like [Punica granatum]|uniref:Abscisic stress-ripening protein 5-like n=1 Tax=Punica granatum TaxID=22663 RepID=A0A6P8D154_PUNGR|nr:abscisic stress-ripening protein 5-like [Punica granatum]